jgi:hypothetical protein
MSENVIRFPGRDERPSVAPTAEQTKKRERFEDRLPRASEVGRLDLASVPRTALEQLTSSVKRLNEVSGRAADHLTITGIIAMRTGMSEQLAIVAAVDVVCWLMTGEQMPTPPEAT